MVKIPPPAAKQMLFAMAEEFSELDRPKTTNPKMTPEEHRRKNIAEGRPPKSHLPWDEDEKNRLIQEFEKKIEISQLSAMFERSTLAIAVQLQKLKLISDEELESVRQH